MSLEDTIKMEIKHNTKSGKFDAEALAAELVSVNKCPEQFANDIAKQIERDGKVVISGPASRAHALYPQFEKVSSLVVSMETASKKVNSKMLQRYAPHTVAFCAAPQTFASRVNSNKCVHAVFWMC